ncbi:L-lactate dehydrogenase [Hyphodiscus hymeniophilus]|uniref:L-lactate dehydrogenase n=1 Tax=Hyphodiscus hymeniophilus TaxID=353542 RepID=A0A9P7B0V4_9HELO|nr:L-lactate dehydrogenase [Hyphodiscus hymeniophilus]
MHDRDFSISSPSLVKNGASSPPKSTLRESFISTHKTPSLRAIINITDFEAAAAQIMEPRSFAFYNSGAEDEITKRWNQKNWQSIRFRPRVLVPIESVEICTTILGNKYTAPFFMSPTGAGDLAHPEGQMILAKVAASNNVMQWVSHYSRDMLKEIMDTREGGQVFYQTYISTDLRVTEMELRGAIAIGYGGFALTVDAPRIGKREQVLRSNIEDFDPRRTSKLHHGRWDCNSTTVSFYDLTRASCQYYCRPSYQFDWISAVKWIRGITDLPIAIKGIQTWEDAALCMQHGVHPYLSNHGGRQLEGAPSAVETLLEIREHCPEVFQKCEVMVDGGVKRGTDIVKALALGAKAVGLGRGFLYPLVFGERGLNKAMGILKHEVETTMALLGVTSVDQLTDSYVTMSARSTM